MPDCSCTVYTNTELLVSPINLVIPSLVHVNKAIILSMYMYLYIYTCTCTPSLVDGFLGTVHKAIATCVPVMYLSYTCLLIALIFAVAEQIIAKGLQ